ncbi:MAG: hypothetical protein FWD40_04140 [Treponema sp.]|nr:hypothetical protein [Treponema sp.]
MAPDFVRSKLTVLLLILILVPVSLSADFGDDFKWAAMGSIFYFAADNGPSADPPAILPTAGFSASWQINGPLRLEVTEDIYFTNYEFNFDRGYPMACNPENRSAFVIGFVTAVQLTGNFTLGYNGTAIRVYGGPAADFRIVTLALGLHPNDMTDAQQQTDAIFEYFWSNGRWFNPVLGTGMDFPLNEHYMLGFDLRVWLPAYKIWNNDNTPAIDGWRFGIGLRITP